jgi:hypothetical protein
VLHGPLMSETLKVKGVTYSTKVRNIDSNERNIESDVPEH